VFWGAAALLQLGRGRAAASGVGADRRRLPPSTLVLVVTYCWLGGLAILLIRSLLTPGTVHQPGLLAAGLLGLIALIGLRQVREVFSNASLNQALREIADSREQFRRLFLLFPDAALLTRLDDGVFVEVNEGFTRVYGFEYAECIGKSAFELGLWADEADRQVFVEELRRHGLIAQREGRARRRDGTIRIVEMSARVVEIGGRPHLLNLVRDLTEKKAVEERLRRSEDELRRAQRLEAIGTLAGGIAHDFNNLLTAIMGGIELAMMDVAPEGAVHGSLERTLAASRRARDLVRQILLLSRRQERPTQPVDVTSVVEEVARFVRPSLQAGISLSVRAPGQVPPVLGDVTQLHQVFLNLVTNAVQAVHDQPSAAIEIVTDTFHPDERFTDLHPAVGNRNHVRVVVRDNGCGMSAEVMHRIFEPFFTTKRSGAGTGLGLAVAHGVIHNHDGIITVDSMPGRGSTFTVLLPAAPELTAKRGSNPGFVVEGHGEAVLVVDDDLVVEETLCQMLVKIGYRPVTFSQPEQAVAFMEKGGDEIRAVVSDFSMAGMDGIEVAKRIKARRPRLPFVLLSGYLTSETLERAQAAGLEHLLDKPILIDELARVVAECVAASKPAN
jgi:PAS domain S-box-containing protein